MANDTVTIDEIEVAPYNPVWNAGQTQALYSIGEAIVEESTTFTKPVMLDKIDALVQNYKLPNSKTCCYFASSQDPDGTSLMYIGAIAGFVQDSWFDGSTSLNDFFLYVYPGARRTTAAAQLIAAYEAYGRSVGVDKINLGISTGLRQKALGRFYESAGYQQSATQYTKEIDNVL
tara:strand:+ start:765 stop:1289 length:525 start_codon:yes stop_codon:yes gene_type:complete